MPKTGFFSIPLKMPHLVVNPTTGTSLITIQTYPGRIALFGKVPSNVPSYLLLYNIVCSDITGEHPDPLYAEVPDYVNDESLDVFPILAPNTITDNNLLTYIQTLAP